MDRQSATSNIGKLINEMKQLKLEIPSNSIGSLSKLCSRPVSVTRVYMHG